MLEVPKSQDSVEHRLLQRDIPAVSFMLSATALCVTPPSLCDVRSQSPRATPVSSKDFLVTLPKSLWLLLQSKIAGGWGSIREKKSNEKLSGWLHKAQENQSKCCKRQHKKDNLLCEGHGVGRE